MNTNKNNSCRSYLEFVNRSGHTNDIQVTNAIQGLQNSINESSKIAELDEKTMNSASVNATKEPMTNQSKYIISTDITCWILVGILIMSVCKHKLK